MMIRVEESNSKVTSLRKNSFKITSCRKQNFSTTYHTGRLGLPPKCIKRRSDGEISSVERGIIKGRKKEKRKKGKQELVNLKFSIARRYYELKFDTHIGARWFERRREGEGRVVRGYVKINFHSLSLKICPRSTCPPVHASRNCAIIIVAKM